MNRSNRKNKNCDPILRAIGGKMNNCENARLTINESRTEPIDSGQPAADARISPPPSAGAGDSAIRELLTMRSDTRRRRAALANELRTVGKSLHGLGGALKHASGSSMGGRVDHILPKLANVPAVCDLGRLKLMLEELKELETRLVQLNRSISEIGID